MLVPVLYYWFLIRHYFLHSENKAVVIYINQPDMDYFAAPGSF